MIADLSASLNLTVFMITHDLDSLYAICDRVAVIADKKVVAVGTVARTRKIQPPLDQGIFPWARAAGRGDAFAGTRWS